MNFVSNRWFEAAHPFSISNNQGKGQLQIEKKRLNLCIVRMGAQTKGRHLVPKRLLFYSCYKAGGGVKPIYKKIRTTFVLFCGPPENRPKDDGKPPKTAENRPKDD